MAQQQPVMQQPAGQQQPPPQQQPPGQPYAGPPPPGQPYYNYGQAPPGAQPPVPMDLDVKMKAVMLGAVFLIDFMFFEQKQNNHH